MPKLQYFFLEANIFIDYFKIKRIFFYIAKIFLKIVTNFSFTIQNKLCSASKNPFNLQKHLSKNSMTNFKYLLFLLVLFINTKIQAQKKISCSMYWFNQLQIAEHENDIKKFDESLVHLDLNENLSPPKIAALAEMQFRLGRKMMAFSIYRIAVQNGYNPNFEPVLARDSVFWKRFNSERYIIDKYRSTFYDTLSAKRLKRIAFIAANKKNKKKEVLQEILTLIEQQGFPTYKSVYSEGMNDLYSICRSLISYEDYAETLEPIVKQQTLNGNFDNLIYADISDRHKLYFSSNKYQNYGTFVQLGEISKINDIANIDVRRIEVGLMPLKYAAQFINAKLPENYSYTDLKNTVCP